MGNVMIIPAKRQVGNTSRRQEDKPKLRVAAYCRVSTDSDEQASSYETQVEHYTEYIKKNPEWEFAGIYADDGISGTNTKKREEFNRMIEACKAGEIDMIITKSISRFARNTLDCLKYIRMLKDKNIPVFFEKESINTMDAKGEVLLTIMASLAQQESQSLSQNVKMGLQFRYQNGQVQVNHNHFLGYTKDREGNLVIDPEQAEVVKRIYREYLEGSSMDKIAKGLEKDGILTGAGKKKWWTSTINKILRNEKYIGDALLQKTYTTDFLNKTRVKNNGIVPQYYVENNHEAIIPKDIFLRVQEELVRRRVVKTSANGKKRSYSCNHCFAQLVICGECGEMFRRIHWNNRGCKSIVWRCLSRLEATGMECHARTVNETVLENVVVQAINTLLGDKSAYQAQLQQNIAKVIREAQKNNTDGIDEQLMELQKELLEKANNKEAYDEIAQQIFKLREQCQQCTVDTAARDAQIARITDLQDYIKKQRTNLESFDETLVKRWLKQITVWEDHFTVELKSGLKIDIEG
jgi:site-specific DNA recombinase|nr:MAG TPA: integrase [Caudoviricetes sp.]